MIRWVGLVGALTGVLLLLAAACFFSYRSGCVFNPYHGYGNFALGNSYDALALVLLVAEILCLVASAVLICRGLLLRTILATSALVLGVPLTIYLMLEANLHGVLQCKPV
jgi:hypothetical protein